PDQLATFETGARYQMYHALALLFVAWAVTRWPLPPVRAAGWLFVAGTVVFSGSLYLLALTGSRAFGAVTPLGGLAFLGGWLALAVGVWRSGPQAIAAGSSGSASATQRSSYPSGCTRAATSRPS